MSRTNYSVRSAYGFFTVESVFWDTPCNDYGLLAPTVIRGDGGFVPSPCEEIWQEGISFPIWPPAGTACNCPECVHDRNKTETCRERR
jgi:hypothetical protein